MTASQCGVPSSTSILPSMGRSRPLSVRTQAAGIEGCPCPNWPRLFYQVNISTFTMRSQMLPKTCPMSRSLQRRFSTRQRFSSMEPAGQAPKTINRHVRSTILLCRLTILITLRPTSTRSSPGPSQRSFLWRPSLISFHTGSGSS